MSRWTRHPSPPVLNAEEDSRSSNSVEVVSATELVDPYIKNPEYVRYKNAHRRSRSRSRSYERHRRRKRSRSRRRSHSRSGHRRHRHHSHSSSRSRSRSSSYERRHRKHKTKSRRHSRSRSGSRSRHRPKYERSRKRSPASDREDPFVDIDEKRQVDEEEEGQDQSKDNAFKNDGSFLEMFKKMQEEKARAEQEAAASASFENEERRAFPMFGKRRGGKILKTGLVEKPKTVEEQKMIEAKDPWSIYLQEVKKYKEATCDDDSKTRPLVK